MQLQKEDLKIMIQFSSLHYTILKYFYESYFKYGSLLGGKYLIGVSWIGMIQFTQESTDGVLQHLPFFKVNEKLTNTRRKYILPLSRKKGLIL